jgi:hypothetical protein
MANINELMQGWSFGKQADIITPCAVAKIWRHTNLNTKPWAKVPVNEDDRAEIGKGHEFPTQLFKSHYNMPTFEISKYASSEFLAWAMAFSLGNVVLTGTGPYTYVIVPALGATSPTGLELPYFSFVQQIRPGGSAILDEILVGCAVKGWKLSIKNSPGRASAMCSVECVATGQYTTPSGITLPAVGLPHEFNAGMVSALTINGVNYLTGGSGKQFVSMDASWENNFRPGFFPGSGTQDGYQIQGRFEFGDYSVEPACTRTTNCTTVTNVEREGINYRIEMKVPGARVTHGLRMPTAKEMQDHERASTSIVAARRSVETRAFLEPSGALYDNLHVSHDGYAGAVPIVHKSAAVSEVVAQLAIEADDDPE